MTHDMSKDEPIVQATYRLVVTAFEANEDAMLDALDDVQAVIDADGHQSLWFSVFCGLAHCVKHVNLTGGDWIIEVEDMRTGEIVNPDAVPDRGAVAAMRFLVAYANDDRPMCYAIFRALGVEDSDAGDDARAQFLISMWRVLGASLRAAV